MNADYGTEIDWMGFFWSVNTSGANKSLMTDIFQIYRHTCNRTQTSRANCSTSGPFAQNVGWEDSPAAFQLGFRNGAERHYGTADPRYDQVLDRGRRFGVDTNLQP